MSKYRAHKKIIAVFTVSYYPCVKFLSNVTYVINDILQLICNGFKCRWS